MASIEEEIRLDEEENLRELDYIRNTLTPKVLYHYSNSDILWIIDAIIDYYYTSGILESQEEEVDIDMEAVAEYVCRRAKDEKVSQSFAQEDIVLMALADLEFQEQNL